MKKILYIHVGVNKTGTTSIQKSLDENKDYLKDNNILYPSAGKIWNGHFKLAWELGAGGNEKQKIASKNSWQELYDEVDLHPHCTKIIVSSENFLLINSPHQLSMVKELFKDFDIKIVIYVRRQDLWVESLYLQAIKMGVCNVSFEEYSKKPGQTLDFNEIINPWLSLTSMDNVIALDFDSEKKNLINNFYVKVLETQYKDELNRKDNESLDRCCAEFLLRYRDVLNKQQDRNNFIMLYNKINKKHKNLNHKFFDSNERVKFLDNYNMSNVDFFNKYLMTNNFDISNWPDGMPNIPSQEIHMLEKQILEEFLLRYIGEL